MAKGSDHLSVAHDQLVEFLQRYPSISIARSSGTPPDEYEILYNLHAYTLGPSGIRIERRHRVAIKLPLGFPHFAPEVRALTPLFHPAITEDHIAVEAQWNKKPSLPDLVLHVAEMITGHICSLDDPANPKAAHWYKTHRKELPLDTPIVATAAENNPVLLLEEEFDPALNLDEEIHGADAVGTIDELDDAASEAAIEEVRDLLARNQLYTLHKCLADLPPDLWFPEREEAEFRVQEVREKVAPLFAQAQQMEEEGRYGKAMECTHAILALMPDEPAALALAQRLQQSSFITDSLTDTLNEQEASTPGQADLPRGKTPAAAPETPKPPPPREPKRPLLPEDFPLRRVLLAVLGVLFLLWGGMYVMYDWSTLSRIQEGIRAGQEQLAAKRYVEAKNSLERARQATGELTLLFFREGGLKRKIDALLNSPELAEGMRGRVLYQGKYVDEAVAKALQELPPMEQQAQALLEQKRYDAALELYTKALRRISAQPMPEERERLGNHIRTIEVERLLVRAAEAEQKQNWNMVMDLYRQAETKAQQAPTALAQQLSRKVAQQQTASQLRQSVAQALDAMDSNRLETARAQLQEAERLLAADPKAISAQDAARLEAVRVQLRLYAILPAAKRAFETRKWGEAVSLYQQAADILHSGSPEVQAALQEAREKVERTLELSRINQMLAEVATAEGQKDWPTVVRQENAVIERIAAGRFAKDPELVALGQGLTERLAKHRLELGRYEKGKWLEKRALDFFRASYPNFQESAATEPKARFVRREGGKQIFELSCLDNSGGRASKLVLLYAFDERTGQWAPFK